MASSQDTTTVKRSWSGSGYDAVAQLLAANNLVRRGIINVDLPNIANGAVGTVDIAIAGSKTTDFAAVQPPADITAGLIPISARVSADGTLTIAVLNVSGGAVDEAAADWDYLLVGNDQLSVD